MSVHPLDILMMQATQDGVCNAAAAQAIQEGNDVFACEVGAAPDTLFDIASVTKIMSTTVSLYHMVSEGLLGLDDPVCRYLPGFGRQGKAGVTIRGLLGHRSGMPAWSPMFAAVMRDPVAGSLFRNPENNPRPSANVLASARKIIIDQVISAPLTRPPGTRVYSDLGFIALGVLIEEVVGQSLHNWTQSTIFPKLELNRTTYRPLKSSSTDGIIPPTGLCRPREPAPGQESLYVVPPQEELDAPGFVDDDNAFAMGGVAGHAGLFASARDVALFGWQMMEELDGAERLGRSEVLREMILPDKDGGEPFRGLGFDHPSGANSSVGRHMSRDGDLPTFGHLGFTGCSLWVDPVRRLSVSLLSNRVFPTRKNVEGIKGFRPVFHDALIDHLETNL